MKFLLKSVLTKNLNKKNILDICKLKNSHWKFGIKEQLNWFKKNIKINDIHNLCFKNDKLVGYTALRKITKNSFARIKVNKDFLLFDTLILNKKCRSIGLGMLLMSLNNFVIKREKKLSLLICQKKKVQFYKKNSWKKFTFKKCRIYKKKNSEIMMYNLN